MGSHANTPKSVRGNGANPPAAPVQNALALVADVSNYSGNITDAQAEAMKAAGVAGAIVRIDTADPGRIAIMQQQAGMFRAHGVSLGGYLFPNYEDRPADELTRVWQLAGPLRSLWIDLEPVSGVMPTSFAVFRWWMAQAALAMPSITTLGIYTAAWVVQLFGAKWMPLPYPLWAAAYGDRPTSLAINFGGWPYAAGIQFSDAGDIAGVSCDLSVFRPDLFT